MIRLDPAPLLEAARDGRPWHQAADCPYCYGRNGYGGEAPVMDTSTRCATGDEVAQRLDTSLRQIQRWLHGTRIQMRTPEDVDRIDRMAIAAGSHPLVVWPELDDAWALVATSAPM